jgi:hypothetical protein
MAQKEIIYMYYINKMNINYKKNDTYLDDYINAVSNNYENSIPIYNKCIKINCICDDTQIPNLHNYNEMLLYNYNVTQLKTFAKHYKLKMGGNKNDIFKRVYYFLRLSSYIIKIQKKVRGNIVRKYIELHGPAGKDRKKCNNVCDFVTMEPVEEIDFHQIFSYKDEDGFIYAFDIVSLHNLYEKSDKEMQNPYNRKAFPSSAILNLKLMVKLGKILKIAINLDFEDSTKSLSSEKAIELRSLALFQAINLLGNYSNSQWFLSLNRNQLIKFLRELNEIWSYRAQLSNETKRNICPPNGDPFRDLNMTYIYNESNMNNVKKKILEIMEKFVSSGIDTDSKSLGAYYILGALTLVNTDAAIALPWLFQSVSYF